MYKQPRNKLQFTDEHKRILRNTAIRQDAPGTILHDFAAALSFLRSSKEILTPTHQLTLGTVKAINQRLQHPVELSLKRPVPKSYPPVLGLYLLLRASGLTTVDSSGNQPSLRVDEAAYSQWLSLSATEQYFSLLEAWLLRGFAEIIGDDQRASWEIPDNLERVLSFVQYSDVQKGLPVAGKRGAYEELKYRPGLHNLGIMYLLGIIDIEVGSLRPNEGWNIERITLTSFGTALLSLLFAELAAQFHQMLYAEPGEDFEEEGAELKSIIQPYFPTWENTFVPPAPAFVEGTHVFKVTVMDAWRRIAISAQEPLDTLAHAILASVQFDDDHLYDFQYRNRIGKNERISHPYNQDPPLTSEVRVGDLGLEIGQHMTFLFDYGDNWEFDVVLEVVGQTLNCKCPKFVLNREKHLCSIPMAMMMSGKASC
ncbi:MAG: plasmid pRiA4b ORF-3 family protein [Chloroflexi bacterium]|uniref:IS1096 element passenger TnpR family protein n=1 Tax=Candidatus Flexifilum breve TaxID=3140694 RepID=UPI0031369C31|nr:plasmid pRiA4b ORF-3 family protein [Chloroflexota bacterium]